MILTRKIQLYVVGDKEEKDRVYQYIRNGSCMQNKAMNQYISNLYIEEIANISKEDRKELSHLYGRISTSRKGSAYTKDMQFPVGLPTASALQRTVKQDFNKSKKDGLLSGKVSLPNYRKDGPLLVHVDFVRLRSTNPHQDNGIYHNYESHAEFLDHLWLRDLQIYIKFVNNITFQLYLGSPRKSAALRSELQQIFEENYKICGSSIQIVDKKIILNLSIEIPKTEVELDEDIVVGVDLGIAIPAVCAINNSNYKSKYIGSKDDFLRVRTQLQSQYRRNQMAMKSARGGHGRQKKMQAMDRLKKRERNFVQTYNHYISKQVVDFAVKNRAKYINLENLTGIPQSGGQKNKTNQFVLRNWSYFELQQYITYKAARYGIEVRKINPFHTSQICSCCGHWEEGQRIDQAHFKCKSCGTEMNADLNAARNIAMSNDFITNKSDKSELLCA